jgi:hypothetical protein
MERRGSGIDAEQLHCTGELFKLLSLFEAADYEAG